VRRILQSLEEKWHQGKSFVYDFEANEETFAD
jgi:hypothetical protein